VADLRAARAKKLAKSTGALAKLRQQKQRKPALAALRTKEAQRKKAEAIKRVEAIVQRYNDAWDEESAAWKAYDKIDQRRIRRDPDKLQEAKETWNMAARKLDNAHVALLNTIAANRSILG
jgi:hypothetical protein